MPYGKRQRGGQSLGLGSMGCKATGAYALRSVGQDLEGLTGCVKLLTFSFKHLKGFLKSVYCCAVKDEC